MVYDCMAWMTTVSDDLWMLRKSIVCIVVSAGKQTFSMDSEFIIVDHLRDISWIHPLMDNEWTIDRSLIL